MMFGSHNTFSYAKPKHWFMYPFAFMARCQRIDWKKQYILHNIRVFDLRVWFDKDTRVGLFNLLNIEKASNTETITLWFSNTSIEIQVDKAMALLTTVEKYAKQCYDNTQKHYVEINQLESIEDCLQYDITAGYSTILNITLTD